MLTRSPCLSCIECAKPMGKATFGFHRGRRENGPAYWSDEGVICSPACATAHFSRRQIEGREMRKPADEPVLAVAPSAHR